MMDINALVRQLRIDVDRLTSRISDLEKGAVAVSRHDQCISRAALGPFASPSAIDEILRFTSRSDAETLCRLLGVGHPVLVYTDTMEPVPS